MSKKRAAKKGRKKARSPAQEAATKRMLAANKSKHGGRKTAKRSKAKRAPSHAKHRKGQLRKAAKARRKGKRPMSAYSGYATFKAAKHEGKGDVRRGSGKRHTHKKRVAGYIRRVNPFHHARNPSMSMVKTIVGGALIGVAAGAVVPAVVNRFFPGNINAGYIGLAVAVGGGLALATKHPVLGPALATGALAGGLAPMVAAKVEGMIASTAAQKHVAGMRMGAIKYSNQMGAVTARMAAVSADMGAVTARMGAVSAGPFGQSPFG